MQPKVTVLTCVYNGLPYLKEAIESTLNQTYTDFEYLIIDDASPDKDVVKFIESYNDPRIRFVKNEKNLGVSNTINKALTLITTPYVVRIDQDDINLPNRIEEQIAFLEKNKDIDIVCSWEHTIDSHGNKIRDWQRVLDNYGAFLGYVLIGICPIWHPSLAFRTKAMVDAGGFKVEYTRAEDFEVTTRLALKRYGAAVVPKFHLLQRQHDDSQSKEFDDEQASVTRRVHTEAIKTFSSHPDIDLLGDFLLLKTNNSVKFDKNYLDRVRTVMDDLFKNIIAQQRLSDDELESFTKVIHNRTGLGVKYAPLITKFPSFLFYPVYYILSPLQIPNMRKVLSRLHHNLMCLRQFLK